MYSLEPCDLQDEVYCGIPGVVHGGAYGSAWRRLYWTSSWKMCKVRFSTSYNKNKKYRKALRI